MTPAVEGRNVSVVRGGRAILVDATVGLTSHSLTAVLGPNGSGKSTLLRVLAGLWPVSNGVVMLDGVAMGDLPRRDVARRLAFLPQNTRCDFALTVDEMVSMGRHPHRGRFERERECDRQAIESAIATCDLGRLRLRRVDRLSGGERQRVAIARCLAAEPGIVILDEPTAHLDLEHGLSILALCRSLADAGRAVAIATHDVSAIAQFATQVILLNHGRIVGDGTPEQVLTPARCRSVFAVDSEIVATADGRRAFVFSTPDTAMPTGFQQGVHR